MLSQKRILAIAIAGLALTLLIVAFVANLYQNGNSKPKTTPQETPTPSLFEYTLHVSPASETIMQGNTIQVNVTITSILGSPQNITLNASGIPEGADFSFSPPQGAPRSNTAFTSTLTIQVSEAVPTKTYNIIVQATAQNGKTQSSTIKLSVLNAKVTVSGTVNGGIGITPKQVVFERLSGSGERVEKFVAPVNSGTYKVVLPNNQFYALSVVWEDLDGYCGAHYFIMPCGVNAGVGKTSLNCPIEWEYRVDPKTID